MPVHLEIISPDKVFFDGEADMALLPGTEGDIAAEPSHAPVLISLRPGLVKFYRDGEIKGSYFVTGGIGDIRGDECTVLADHLKELSELSLEAAQKRVADIASAMTFVTGEQQEDPNALLKQSQIAQAELEAAKEALKH